MRLLKGLLYFNTHTPKFLKIKVIITLVLTVIVSILANFSIIMLAPIFQALVGNSQPSTIWEQLFYRYTHNLDYNDKLFLIVGVFLIVAFSKFLVQIIYTFFAADTIYSFREYFTTELFKKYYQMPLVKLLSKDRGELLSDILNQPAMASDSINSLIQFSRILVSVCTTFMFIFLTNVYIGVVLVVVVLIIYISIVFVRKPFRLIGKRMVETSQSLSSLSVDAFSLVRVARIQGVEAKLNKLFGKLSEKRRKAYVTNYFLQLLPTNSFELMFAIGGGVFIFGYAIFIGDLLDFLPTMLVLAGLVYGLFSLLFNSVEKLLNFMAFLPAARLVYSLMEDKEEIRERNPVQPPIEVSSINDDIVFRDLSYSYPNGKDVFKELNGFIPKIGITVVAGSSGSGKSTLLDVVCGLLNNYSGSVTINGAQLDNVHLATYQNLISYCPQEPVLLTGSIKENIALFEESPDSSRIDYAITHACADDFISSNVSGLERQVSSSSGLSGGQKQRLCLARCLYKQADIYVFDEPTSALDKETEIRVLRKISEISKDKCVVIISHSSVVLDFADNVIDLRVEL